jgi:hypothetical protein
MGTIEERDEGLGTAIGARLREEMAELTAPPDLAATVRRRYGRQRWAVAGAALALPLVAGGLAVLLATTGGQPGLQPGGQSGAGDDRSANGAPSILTVAYVVDRAQQALDATADSVVHTVTTVDDGTAIDSWSDLAGPVGVSTVRIAGQLAWATRTSVEGDRITLLSVDYRRHTWQRDTLPREAKMPAGAYGVPYGDRDVIRENLASGQLELVGTEQVAGHTAEHLRLVLPTDEQALAGMDLWVDSTTYAPVQLTGHKGKVTFTVKYDWLPRTPENLARLTLAPPADFTEGAAPAGGAATPAPKASGKG